MREIKFRAWESEFHKTHPNPTPNMIEWKYLRTWSPMSWGNIPLMQYTGLKDKNGVEIYEGDIVEEYFGAYGNVCFENGCFVLEILEDTNRPLAHYIMADFGNKCEVIGNIYENKELLDEKSK